MLGSNQSVAVREVMTLRAIWSFMRLAFVASSLATTLQPAVVQATGSATAGSGALALTRDLAQERATAAIGSAERFAARKQLAEHAAPAQRCLALVAADHRESSIPTEDSISALFAVLVDTKDLFGDWRIGWAVPATLEKQEKCPAAGMVDACGDGSCNLPNAGYTFQNGLVVMCRAQACVVACEVCSCMTTKWARADSWDVGQRPAGCNDRYLCWHSCDNDDAQRHVQRTNALMGATATRRIKWAPNIRQLWAIAGA